MLHFIHHLVTKLHSLPKLVEFARDVHKLGVALPTLSQRVLDSLDSPKEIEYSVIVEHDSSIEDSIQGFVDLVVDAKHLPTGVVFGRL